MTDYRTPASFLRVVFPAPGFFLNDARVTIAVDGWPVHEASFKQGFDWWAEMAPGRHVVVASIGAPLGFSRTKRYALEVRPGLTTIAVLGYSRLWGNFDDRPVRVDFVPR